MDERPIDADASSDVDADVDQVLVAREPVGVMVVDDQAPFRIAARAVVGRIVGFELVAEAMSGEEAIGLADSLHPSLVLMDINMGAVDGLAATREIVARNPDTLVILVSTYPIDDLPADARRCGAVAYVDKEELSPRVIRELWESGGDETWSVHRG